MWIAKTDVHPAKDQIDDVSNCEPFLTEVNATDTIHTLTSEINHDATNLVGKRYHTGNVFETFQHD